MRSCETAVLRRTPVYRYRIRSPVLDTSSRGPPPATAPFVFGFRHSPLIISCRTPDRAAISAAVVLADATTISLAAPATSSLHGHVALLNRPRAGPVLVCEVLVRNQLMPPPEVLAMKRDPSICDAACICFDKCRGSAAKIGHAAPKHICWIIAVEWCVGGGVFAHDALLEYFEHESIRT